MNEAIYDVIFGHCNQLAVVKFPVWEVQNRGMASVILYKFDDASRSCEMANDMISLQNARGVSTSLGVNF